MAVNRYPSTNTNIIIERTELTENLLNIYNHYGILFCVIYLYFRFIIIVVVVISGKNTVVESHGHKVVCFC